MTRWSRLLAGGIAAIAIAGTAPWLAGAAGASQNTPPSGDTRATVVSGNAVTCADVGFPNDQQVGASDSSGATGAGFTVTSDGQYLTLTTIPAGVQVDTLIVKGGDAYNQYASSWLVEGANGFHAPLVGGGKNVPTISHWFLCYGPSSPTPPVTAPSATAQNGDCNGVDLVLAAGSSDTTFLVTRAGDASGASYPVGAGQSQTVHVTLDSTHPSVSVTVGGVTVGNGYTRGADCDTSNGGGGNNGGGNNGGGNNGGGNNTGGGTTGGTTTGGTTTGGSTSGGGTAAPVANPGASATHACTSGITLTLTNVGGTAPVTFTLTAPNGSTSTVTLQPNQSATKTFAVAEDTTGHVTASAPGLTRTFSYHKNCTQVLGVKHVRHSKSEGAVVLGLRKSKGAVLPFTGFDARSIALDAQLLIMAGGVACWAGRRRRAQRAR